MKVFGARHCKQPRSDGTNTHISQGTNKPKDSSPLAADDAQKQREKSA